MCRGRANILFSCYHTKSFPARRFGGANGAFRQPPAKGRGRPPGFAKPVKIEYTKTI
ncbi:hypothetical protein HMPREF0262_03237 [Clostridium sp. ATCC 29733]|nr:hypothetical protein HMPREF0262_03237 [Clostridium sp. ATCC 29733]